MRRAAGVDSSETPFWCGTCKADNTDTLGKTHQVKFSERLKIAISSSTLHEFWLRAGYKGDVVHIDWLTSPGATIQALHEMWKLDYAKEKRGQDLVIIAGLNNIIRGDTNEKFMERIRSFHRDVIEQARIYHPEKPNTFCVATLLYPSKLCWLEGDGPLPSDGYDNQLGRMTELNDQIINFNNQKLHDQSLFYETHGRVINHDTVSYAPGFHTYGTRKLKKMIQGKRVPIREHRWDWWRKSEDRSNKLHLTDEKRCKMGASVGSYFQWMFRNPPPEVGNNNRDVIDAAVEETPIKDIPEEDIPAGSKQDENNNAMEAVIDAMTDARGREDLLKRMNSFLGRKKNKK